MARRNNPTEKNDPMFDYNDRVYVEGGVDLDGEPIAGQWGRAISVEMGTTKDGKSQIGIVVELADGTRDFVSPSIVSMDRRDENPSEEAEDLTEILRDGDDRWSEEGAEIHWRPPGIDTHSGYSIFQGDDDDELFLSDSIEEAVKRVKGHIIARNKVALAGRLGDLLAKRPDVLAEVRRDIQSGRISSSQVAQSLVDHDFDTRMDELEADLIKSGEERAVDEATLLGVKESRRQELVDEIVNELKSTFSAFREEFRAEIIPELEKKIDDKISSMESLSPSPKYLPPTEKYEEKEQESPSQKPKTKPAPRPKRDEKMIALPSLFREYAKENGWKDGWTKNRASYFDRDSRYTNTMSFSQVESLAKRPGSKAEKEGKVNYITEPNGWRHPVNAVVFGYFDWLQKRFGKESDETTRPEDRSVPKRDRPIQPSPSQSRVAGSLQLPEAQTKKRARAQIRDEAQERDERNTQLSLFDRKKNPIPDDIDITEYGYRADDRAGFEEDLQDLVEALPRDIDFSPHPTPSSGGKLTTIVVYGGNSFVDIRAKYALIELDRIVSAYERGSRNPSYPSFLRPQPYNQKLFDFIISRIESDNWEDLYISTVRTEQGPPIIDKHGTLISGEERIEALREVPQADYDTMKEALSRPGITRLFGVTQREVMSMTKPVLVRILGQVSPQAVAELQSSLSEATPRVHNAEVDISFELPKEGGVDRVKGTFDTKRGTFDIEEAPPLYKEDLEVAISPQSDDARRIWLASQLLSFSQGTLSLDVERQARRILNAAKNKQSFSQSEYDDFRTMLFSENDRPEPTTLPTKATPRVMASPIISSETSISSFDETAGCTTGVCNIPFEDQALSDFINCHLVNVPGYSNSVPNLEQACRILLAPVMFRGSDVPTARAVETIARNPLYPKKNLLAEHIGMGAEKIMANKTIVRYFNYLKDRGA